VEAIGVGWFSTISAVFLIVSGLCVWATTIFGDKWRNNVDERNQRKEEKKLQDNSGERDVEKTAEV
jgi:hypothetical protein